jgi:hypothetical protein
MSHLFPVSKPRFTHDIAKHPGEIVRIIYAKLIFYFLTSSLFSFKKALLINMLCKNKDLDFQVSDVIFAECLPARIIKSLD